MPNLVGCRDASPPPSVVDQARHNTLVDMQMEALGLSRRDFLSTRDFKENRATFVPVADLESRRLVNTRSIGSAQKSKLEGWNNAWTCLQDDDSDARNLQAVNEGLGQTHRAKLMQDVSGRDYTGEDNFQKGRGGKGGRSDHIGRGGGSPGRSTARAGGAKAKGERKVTFQNGTTVQPLTRVRVPRAHLTAQVDESRLHPAPILKSGPGVKAARGDSNVLNVPTVSIRSPVRYEGVLAAPNAFMASVGLRKEEAQNDPNTTIVPPTTNVSNKEGAEYNVTTSMMMTNKSTSKEKAVTHKSNTAIDTSSVKTTTGVDKPEVSVNSRPKADLMDLDCDQQTTQPVLQFTAPKSGEQLSHPVVQASPSFEQHIEALERRGVLSADQLEALKLIAAQVRIREDAENLVKETPRQKTYTKSELVSLRPAAASPNVTTGIAKKFAEQQKAFLIGEHVHKTRYHTAASLTEDFEKLSITDKKPVDKKPVNAPAKNLQNIEKSKINPFGPPPTKGKGPSLPAHLLNQTSTADHRAAARAQYSSSNDILAPVSTQQSPADVTPTARPVRRNMINQTGFIALAQNRVNAVAATNKGENPLLVARKQGM